MRKDLAYQQPLLQIDTLAPNDHARYCHRSGAFVDNMSLPVHRWYRYSAGFSADWVRSIVAQCRERSAAPTVLDPFCGVGTTLLACDAENVRSLGFETHPFVYRIAAAKVHGIHANFNGVSAIFQEFLEAVRVHPSLGMTALPPLLAKCYTPPVLSRLLAMRNLFLKDFDKGTPEAELLWLAITAILRDCSPAGTAQWQYVLPRKTKSTVTMPLAALELKATEMLQDIEHAQSNRWAAASRIQKTDARSPGGCPNATVDTVVTSPPYPNNYDYADATRLEMTFWGEISGWGDLHHAVRQHLIPSCSQHASAERLQLRDLLSDTVLEPIRDELSASCQTLARVRETRGGKKAYHTMAAAYFRDLGLVFRSLRPVCQNGSLLCFVIGDSAPYGVYLSVDQWLGKLAIAAGFKSYSFEKIRDRNVKWRNRKHRVPLKEGRLWIEG